MSLILFLLMLVLLSLFLSRIFFHRIILEEKLVKNEFKSSSVYIPFYNGHLKQRELKIRLFISEILGVVVFLIFGLGIYSRINDLTNFETIDLTIFFVFMLIITVALLYLSIYDILMYAIPADFSRRIFLFAIFFNIFLVLFNELGLLDAEVFNLGDLSTLLAFIVAIGSIFLLVRFSKEAGMGSGDIDVVGIIALSVGWPNVFVALYSAIVIGAIVGISYGLYKRKIRGEIIPFVPLLTLGYAIAVGFSERIVDLVIW